MSRFGNWLVLLILIMEGDSQVVPQIPIGVELGTVSIFNIWEHALRKQQRAAAPREDASVGTLLSPVSFLVVNLVPADAPHPLYCDEYESLRTEFLLDYMIQEPVLPSDPKMAAPDGLVVTNLNGKEIKFKKDVDGQISINGVSVEGTKTVNDGPIVYDISDFLFGHQEKVKSAFEEVLRSHTQHFGHQMNPFMPVPPEEPF
ncbi:uncharacterized protein LOC135217907 isoform X1 [Macrobrachium nipponense]|uniref:uncharacterized protein LOC135217907 isoform X1 n=2 Tax=Macrobrachium nipponense TaxID=159736 RepID=UPI0030C7DD09